MGEAVEHIGEYYNEARSAIYPQFRCYTDPSDVGTFSFRYKIHFRLFFASFGHMNRAAVYMPKESKNNQKWVFNRKLKVPMSVIVSHS